MIDTDRLYISLIEIADVQLIYDIFTDPVCIQFIGDRGIRSLDDAKAYIKDRFEGHYQAHGFAMYKVALKNGQGIGICGLIQRLEHTPPDLGFAFVTDYRGGGYCTEAAQAVLAYEQKKHNHPALLAYTDPENVASMRVLEKLGFTQQQITQLPGQDFDSVVFELKPSCA